MQKQKMLKQYIKDKKLLRYFLPFIRSDSEFDEEWKVGRIVDKLLGEDHEGNPKSESIGKKGSDRKITKINPFNPSNIALHLTGHIYNISPDTVRSIIYRS